MLRHGAYAVHLLTTGILTDFEIDQPFCLDTSLSLVSKDAIEVFFFLFFVIIITTILGIVEAPSVGFFNTRIYTIHKYFHKFPCNPSVIPSVILIIFVNSLHLRMFPLFTRKPRHSIKVMEKQQVLDRPTFVFCGILVNENVSSFEESIDRKIYYKPRNDNCVVSSLSGTRIPHLLLVARRGWLLCNTNGHV